MSSRTLAISVASLAVIVTPSVTLAETIYLAAQETTLFRITEGDLEAFDMGREMFSLLADPMTGTIYGTAREENGFIPMFTIQDAIEGTPTMQPFARLDHFYGSMTKIGDLFYGFQGGESGNVYEIDVSDPDNPIETLLGSTGIPDPGGAAFDPGSDTLYMTSLATASLYTVDQDTGESSLVGDTGLSPLGFGLEWWEDQLHVAVQNEVSGDYEIGVLGLDDATYEFLFEFDVPAAFQATSLAIIPEPTSLSLFAALAAVVVSSGRLRTSRRHR